MALIHIDRMRKLTAGTTLDLFTDYRIESFPDMTTNYTAGISEHGHRYGFATEQSIDAGFCDLKALEWWFEGVRLASYPNCLSRLQAVFTVDESDVARLISSLGIAPDVPCFEVTSARIEKRDMALLTGDIASAYLNACKYWKGQCAEQPLYEYLLRPPVKVIRKLTLEDIETLKRGDS
jgi:hypothetical protein